MKKVSMAPKTRPCKSCGAKHGPPTGKKCRRVREEALKQIVDVFEDSIPAEDEWEDQPPEVVETQDAIAAGGHDFAAMEARFDNRMQKLEQLVSNAMSLEGMKPEKEKKYKRAPARKLIQDSMESPSSSDIEEGFEYQLVPRNRKRDGRSRRKEPAFPQEEFLKDGESMSSMNTVILAGIRQVRQLLDENQPADPLLKHLEFVIKKSTLGVYRHDAYISYDRAVRARADKEGLSAFGVIATEELATSFCPENLLSTKGKDGKTKQRDGGKSSKPPRICRAFNEGACSFRNCIFSHSCLACDEAGHGKADCPKLKPKTASR